MSLPKLVAILVLAFVASAEFVVESHDGSVGGNYVEGAQMILGLYGSVDNLLDECDLRYIPDWLYPFHYMWQMTDDMSSYTEIGEGPYNELPIEPYRAGLKWMVEDGVGGPFDAPIGPTPVAVESTTTVQVTSADGTVFDVVVYVPLKKTGAPQGAGKKLPVILYFHGGCMALCADASTYAGFLTRMATATQHIVVWAGYRLAPENRYPAAVEDAYAAGKWIAQHGAEFGMRLNGGITIMGDSAGGMLTLLYAKLARDDITGVLPATHAIVPIYPMVDWSTDVERFETLHTYGWCNTFPLIEYHIFRDMFLGPNAAIEFMQDPMVSPIYGDLSGLPPMRVYTAEFDMLRSEGEEFARLAHEAGNEVSAVRMMGVAHPALAMSGDVLTGYAELRDWFFADIQERIL